jgi:beta-glucosidase
MPYPEKTEYPVNIETVKKYFRVTENPDEADYALVFIASPIGHGGYDEADVKQAATDIYPYPYNTANTPPKLPAKPALPVAIL